MKKKCALAALLLPILLMLNSSCKKEAGYESALIGDSQAAVSRQVPETEGRMLESPLLKSLRQVTSRFNSTTQAIQSGYSPNDHCVSSAAGGMGYHWANFSMFDPVFDPMQPEVLLYAEGPGGNLRLVAVEYVVINVGQPAPMFGSQAFMVGGAPLPVAHWTLHVWVHEYNPSGTFAPFNPNISCPH